MTVDFGIVGGGGGELRWVGIFMLDSWGGC